MREFLDPFVSLIPERAIRTLIRKRIPESRIITEEKNTNIYITFKKVIWLNLFLSISLMLANPSLVRIIVNNTPTAVKTIEALLSQLLIKPRLRSSV